MFAWLFEHQFPALLARQPKIAKLCRHEFTKTAVVIDQVRRANPLLVTGGPGLTW